MRKAVRESPTLLYWCRGMGDLKFPLPADVHQRPQETLDSDIECFLLKKILAEGKLDQLGKPACNACLSSVCIIKECRTEKGYLGGF